MLLKCYNQHVNKIRKLSSGHNWKGCLHPKAKECSNYHSIALILHLSKVVLKILQARL